MLRHPDTSSARTIRFLFNPPRGANGPRQQGSCGASLGPLNGDQSTGDRPTGNSRTRGHAPQSFRLANGGYRKTAGGFASSEGCGPTPIGTRLFNPSSIPPANTATLVNIGTDFEPAAHAELAFLDRQAGVACGQRRRNQPPPSTERCAFCTASVRLRHRRTNRPA